MADASSGAALSGNTSLASLLSGIFSGGYGLNQLFGSGSSTAAGSAAAGAAAASPFQSQYGLYQPWVGNALTRNETTQTQLSDILQGAGASTQGTQNNLTGLAGYLNMNLGNITGDSGTLSQMLGSGANLQTQLSNLSSNYMNNPAIQAQYQIGLDSVNRGLQASGYGGSGAQQVELEKYGQQFASQAYNQEFQNLISGSNATFSQNQAANQTATGLQQQQYTNTLNSILSQGQLYNQAGQLGLAGLQTQLGGFGTLFSGQQGELNSLGLFSGAQSSSPATAGSILSGQFGNSQTAAGNLGAGLSGILSGVNGLTGGGFGNSVGDLLNNLLGGGGSYGSLLNGGISQFIDQFGGGIGSLGSSLGVGVSGGGLEGLIAGGADTAGSEGLSALLGL